MADLRIQLLSFNHRDFLAGELRKLGYAVSASRQEAGFAMRASQAAAGLILIDGRGQGDDAIALLRDLPDGSQKLVILDRKSARQFDQAVASGATAILGAPFGAAEFAAAVRLSMKTRDLPQERRVVVRPKGLDGLTGIATPVTARAWLASNLANGPVTLMLVTPGQFGMINEAFGSEAGDAVLRAFAQRIEPLVAEIEGASLFARLGGTRFLVALSGDAILPRMILLAQAIADVVERPFSTGGDVIRLGCRIGLVESRENERSAKSLLKRAEVALDAAANDDEEPIKVVSDQAANTSDFAKSLHADLRSAIAHREIQVHFQPQVAIGSGRIAGVEALARWKHPQHGEIGAATLFAVAEQSGYMSELSRHVQEQAVSQAARWPTTLQALRLSINVTSGDIARTAFVREFLGLLDEHNFPPGRLTVEITESGIMSDLETAASVLARLRAAGCRIAIDDFGTGYSSLAWLKELPADYLKIDKGLSSDIAQSGKARKVVKSVIALARSIGMSVIAEGVETESHLQQLTQAGCSYYQGYLCAPAMLSSDLEQLVRVQN